MPHRTIVVVDVASFTDPARTTWHQRAVREGLSNVLRGAFSEAGIDLDTCQMDDRGDGNLILMPPDVDNTRLADQLPSRLVAWLRRHNALHSPEAQMKLRVALHEGEVHQDSNGAVGPAVNLTFRLVDASDARTMLRSTSCVLALISSNDFYQGVIAQDPATDPDSYRQLSVPVHGNYSVVAWLRMSDYAPNADAAQQRASYRRVLDLFPAAELRRLHEMLSTVDVPNLRALVYQAADAAMPPTEGFADARAAFSYLAEFNAGSDGFPPALMFIELVACHDVARDVCADLMRWSDDQAVRLRLEPQLRQRRETMLPIPLESVLYLVIAVEPDGIDPHNLFHVSFWRQDDATRWPPARGETRVVPLADLERYVDQLVMSAERAWSGHNGSAALEFVLPRGLLNVPVQNWHKEHDSGYPHPLCLEYPIVVRSLERMRSPHWHRVWRQRWKLLKTEPASVRVHFAELADTAQPHRIDAILSDHRYVMMVLSAAPASECQPGTDELTAALRAGLPALLWHPEVSSEVLREVITRLVAGDGLGDLPVRARAERRAAFDSASTPCDIDIRGLAVLWDDPGRLVVLDHPPDHPPDQPPDQPAEQPPDEFR